MRAAETIGSRLERVAALRPDSIALAGDGKEVSFGALDAAATAIAHAIHAATQGLRGPVCLLFANKATAIQAIFGAARSGHCYVPLDASDPEERLRFIAADSEPIALLTESALLARAKALAPPGCALIDVERTEGGGGAKSHSDVDAGALAYLYYTSGSTGKPKGVGQTHRNLLFFVDAYSKTMAIDDRDRVSLLYSLSFSAANMDIYGSLLNGATLCTYDLRRDGVRPLANWLDHERVSVLHAVPTVFRELMASLPEARRLPHLRAIDLGGEAVFGRDVELFRAHTARHCILVNHLAATEASVVAQHAIGHASTYAADAMIPVGRCPEKLRVQIRRDDGAPANPNETGEIIVSSPHVSPGYWRRPELNDAAFAPDPGRPGWRRYFSGDFGFLDDDGNLNFLGRRGSRIKLRGHSVELNEVEAALAACKGVTKVAVLAAGGERPSEAERLIAYLAMASEEDRNPLEIRRQLSARVPSYMCPTGFLFLDALPLTAFGKIDRQALARLPEPEEGPGEFEASRDDAERAVAEIFGQLLKRERIGRRDDFFLLGGDSLAAVELQARLTGALGASPTEFHEDATVAGIAARIGALRALPASERPAMPVLKPLWRQGSAPPLFLVHGRHGQAFVSPHFMRLLGNEQPVWVFQARGLDGLREPHATIEAMAGEYVDELRTVRPHGPYLIGALCAGALIAAEMARSLRADGETVLPLLLLDPRARPIQGSLRQFSDKGFADAMKARAATGRIAGPVDDPAYMESLVRVVTTFERAVANHRPRPYDGPAFMLASRDRLRGPHATYLKSVFTGAIEWLEVAATHAQVLDPRNAEFATHLARCLASIRDAASGSANLAPDASVSSSLAVPAASRPEPVPPRAGRGGRTGEPARNGPCPCGSGRRFKHCHGRLTGDEGEQDRVDFVIAGAQRCGTTVLDLYLRENPGVSMPWSRKELHFFDSDESFAAEAVDYGAYHANFAPRSRGALRGESTPSYIYFRPAAARMARYNPALKIVVVLRDPIARAYSHWNKERQRGREPLSFREALRAEPERLRASGRLQLLRSSYVDRGFYARQLQHLWQFFPSKQTLVLRSTDLKADPGSTLERVAGFLGLPSSPLLVPRTAHVRKYEQPIHIQDWEYLAGIYAEEIRELERILGWDCSDWRVPPEPVSAASAGDATPDPERRTQHAE
jgi:amino acid adenylation domain-containing protein